MMEKRRIDTELAIIGTGLAGIAASIFGLNRGISCTLAGNTGALAYTTGYLDLLGFDQNKPIENPWSGLRNLASCKSTHPLARIEERTIRAAFEEFTTFITELGIGYTQPGERNLKALTPAGTVKSTLCVPSTMEKGTGVLAEKKDCIIFGFQGMKGFSAQQICANQSPSWPSLKAKTLSFPGHEKGELYPEVAARSLEVEKRRTEFAELLKREAGESRYVGLPAILGMHNPDAVLADLEEKSGLKIFEIPTMPPSVAGIRLREIIEQTFPQKGMTLIPQQKVRSISFAGETVLLELSDNHGPIEISSKTALLATGRFLSGGLEARFDHVVEPLLGLPVTQPQARQHWYRKEYFDSRGHDIHLAGIEVDETFRPLAKNGEVLDNRLFAAGIILAHQDWIRQRCGAGVAIASAFLAVEEAKRLLLK